MLRLQRSDEAFDCLSAALSLWEKTGDKTGQGFCLRLLGKIRVEQGLFAEGRAHMEYAILLHESRGGRASRLAALEALAEAFFIEERFIKAQEIYCECLKEAQEMG